MLPIDTSGLVYDRTNDATYEAEDLNRVGKMCETIAAAALAEIEVLAAMREQYGVSPNVHTLPDFFAPTVTAKSDFALADTYTLEQMRIYLLNIVNIVTQFPPKNYKPVPESMRFLQASGANNIEENLKQSAENLVSRANETETNIKNTAAAFAYCGEFFSGGLI